MRVRGRAGVTKYLNELNQDFSLAVRPPSESGALARNKHQIQVGGIFHEVEQQQSGEMFQTFRNGAIHSKLKW